MKLKEAIEFADWVKPNGFTEEQKTRWVTDCEGMVQALSLIHISEPTRP